MVFGETFLRDPRELPGEATSWGNEGCRLELPGGVYEVEGLATGQAASLTARFGEASRHQLAGRPVTTIAVRRTDPARFREIDTRGWEYALDFAFTAERVRMVGLGLAAELERGDGGAATLWLARGEAERTVGDVENLLRVSTAYRLLAAGGAMIHCAAVAGEAGAVLAVGRSEAGKTTFSRLAAAGGGRVLSDDLAALRPDADGRWWIDPLPFGGDFGPPASPSPSLPLAAVLRLEQAGCDELRPLRGAQALALLIACAPVVNQDPFRRDELLAALAGLLAMARAPALFTLAFTRDGRGWELVRSTALAAAGARG
jgi:hypothetical protein